MSALPLSSLPQADMSYMYHHMIDCIDQMIWVTCPDGAVEYFSKRWYEFTGVAYGSTNGEAWKGVLHPDDQERACTTWQHSVRTGETYEIEYRLRHRDGHYRWALGRAHPLIGTDGSILKWFGTCTDIHAVKEAEMRAEMANRAKSEFLANMSHEIRTPMNAIIGLINVLCNKADLESQTRHIVDTMQISANTLLDLINDLLDITKIENQQIELEHIPFSLIDVTRNACDMLQQKAAEKGLAFQIELPESLPVLHGDPTRIKQILLNLLNNAIKFTDNGEVRCKLSAKVDNLASLCSFTYHISDTGIGIPEEKLSIIFDKFSQADASTTRKYGGSGLGLAITQQLVELMGGSIKVTSEAEAGTCFTVTFQLPCIQETESLQTSNSFSAQSPRKPHILLAEDYAANVLVARLILEEFGYEMEVVSNGQQAWEAITSKHQHYDAVLMDVQMPKMDGIEVTRRVRSFEKEHQLSPIPIIGVTAHALLQDRQRCLDGGMNDYISKPFEAEQLQSMLLSIITHKAA